MLLSSIDLHRSVFSLISILFLAAPNKACACRSVSLQQCQPSALIRCRGATVISTKSSPTRPEHNLDPLASELAKTLQPM